MNLDTWVICLGVFLPESKILESPLIVKLRANRQKTKDKLGPEIGVVMGWPTTTTR